MSKYIYIQTSVLIISVINICRSHSSSQDVRKIPEGFQFGTATSAYQIEGSWNVDGKSESIWDHLTHSNPCFVSDCSNGDIANDSYRKYRRDIDMIRQLGLDFYRFSISWPRILPTSFPDKINKPGVQYYNNVINELLKYNIEPVVTLYHWDLPQKLQDMGGWTNPYIVDWFGDYSRTVFQLFGDRVKNWITINEPFIICQYGYGNVIMAPALNLSGIADYKCTKNLLLAHARAYHIYEKEFRSKQKGTIGITLDAQWYEPATSNPADVEAALDNHYFTWQVYANPIFSKSGDYPVVVKEKIASISAKQGYFRSRLPEFTTEEREYVRGTSDFFGLNHYFSVLVYRNSSVIGKYDSPSFDEDLGVQTYQPSEWQLGESQRVVVTPWGFYKLLMKIKEDYNNPPVFITENGFATHGGLEDNDRVTYYVSYLNAMLDAIEDGCDVQAYTAWSLMDNFEWGAGYTERFGLFEVDYSSPEKERVPRKSAFVYKEIIRTRSLALSYENYFYNPQDITAAKMTRS